MPVSLSRIAFALAFAASLCLAPEIAEAKHQIVHKATTSVHGPALWTVHGAKGTVYLFGSVHILPPGMHWQTPQMIAATKRADEFVFEIPLDHQDKDAAEALRVQKEIMDQHGMLPPGQSLRGSLPATMVPKYDAALLALEISPNYVDRLQPWLVALIFENAQLYRTDSRAENGVDRQIYALAQSLHKPSRGLETLDQQLAILSPTEQNGGIAELDTVIDESGKQEVVAKLETIVSAWSRGDVKAIEADAMTEFKKDPAGQKMLLDDRNARWVPQIEQMLSENKVSFVTVGVAHLVGPHGVPNLLRAAGYEVDGPDHVATPGAPNLR